MEAGDLVRIGGVETEGFTDYLAVLEVRHITTLVNGTDEKVLYSKTVHSNGEQPDDSTYNFKAPDFYSKPSLNDADQVKRHVKSDGIAHIAIRVNATFNCTYTAGVWGSIFAL